MNDEQRVIWSNTYTAYDCRVWLEDCLDIEIYLTFNEWEEMYENVFDDGLIEKMTYFLDYNQPSQDDFLEHLTDYLFGDRVEELKQETLSYYRNKTINKIIE